MILKFDVEGLRKTRWTEYLTRFLFGGAVTVIAGLVADKFGPGIGGLFLAFPAIFPATASLIRKHEIEKKKKAGIDGNIRARLLVGVDAAGAAMGCLGLIVFGVAVWRMLPQFGLAATLGTATVAWVVTAVSAWIAMRRVWRMVTRRFVAHTTLDHFGK
jgi:uncharacterized membrane protein (GlpM family)